jgi:hypothetical protein
MTVSTVDMELLPILCSTATDVSALRPYGSRQGQMRPIVE